VIIPIVCCCAASFLISLKCGGVDHWVMWIIGCPNTVPLTHRLFHLHRTYIGTVIFATDPSDHSDSFYYFGSTLWLQISRVIYQYKRWRPRQPLFMDVPPGKQCYQDLPKNEAAITAHHHCTLRMDMARFLTIPFAHRVGWSSRFIFLQHRHSQNVCKTVPSSLYKHRHPNYSCWQQRIIREY
jgi:hypothetical protein